MKRSQCGAAHVSFLWVVFLIVLVLFLAGFTYIAWKDKDQSEREKLDAIAKETRATQKDLEAQQKVIELSEIAGFRDESAVGSASDLTAINDKIDVLRGKYPEYVSADITTLDRSIDAIVDRNTKLKRDFDEKSATLETEIRTRREAQGNLTIIEQQMNTRIQELQGQLNDEQQRAAQQKDEDNQRIANLQTQLDELQNRFREVEAQAELATQVADKEISTLEARVLAQSQKLEVLSEPDLPDGQVIATSPESRLAYIDIGGRDGLRRGTKFDVFRYGKGGELIRKGRVEVRDVNEDTAMCGVTLELDDMDPIIKGDIVVNPLYSRDMKRTFVLLGRFPASLNRSFISDRLVALGNGVDETVSSKTDFLVLGDKEEGEFAQELTDTDEYKLADKLGIQIVRLAEIWDFIKY